MTPKPRPALTKAPTKAHPVSPVETKPVVSVAPVDGRSDRLSLFSTRLPSDLHRAVKRAALDHDLSVQELVTEALKMHLERL
jgi:hypothetical protein